jgi:hypothetical protein
MLPLVPAVNKPTRLADGFGLCRLPYSFLERNSPQMNKATISGVHFSLHHFLWFPRFHLKFGYYTIAFKLYTLFR